MPPARKNTPKDSLAGAAGDRVRAIIEAAEASAGDIRAEAESEAQRIRAEAEAHASSLRSEVRSDVRALLASIRLGVDRLQTDLERLEKRLADPEPAERVPTRRDEPVGAPVEEDLELGVDDDEDPDVARAADAAVSLYDESSPGPVRVPPEEPAPNAVLATSTHQVGEAELEGARLVALNMALDGASRDEVGRYLREHYDLPDREGLLDEVYASIGS